MKNLDLNGLLLSISYVLDFVEMDILGVASNHSKRVAYISLLMAEEIGLNKEECFDIVALSIMHDNGLTEEVLDEMEYLSPYDRRKYLERFKKHCIVGQHNVKDFPFLTDTKETIKYHHEKYNGMGFFRLKGEEIPIMAQIIGFADRLDTEFNLKENYEEKRSKIQEYLNVKESKWSSSRVVNAFLSISSNVGFSLDLKDDFIGRAVKRNLYEFEKELNYREIRKITQVFSRIIDHKSRFTAKHSGGLCDKVETMSEYYKKSNEETVKLMIAADLHDIGKLTVPNSILDKPGKLTDEEFKIMKAHTYYTRVCLESLMGFEEITEWASNHHEKLNGTGYPFGFSKDRLDFNSRLMGCLDIYQALIEDRPYRGGMKHERIIRILREMAKQNLIDENIVEDIDNVFGE